MQKAIRDLRVKAIVILGSLYQISEEQAIIIDEFKNSINECLKNLFTPEFIIRTQAHLPYDVIETLKTILLETSYNLLFTNFLMNSPLDELYFDSFVYDGNTGFSVFNRPIRKINYLPVVIDETDQEGQLREKTAILFKFLAVSTEKELSILNEFSESINRSLKSLFTLEFVERAKPQLKLEHLIDLDEIIAPEAFAVLKKLSVSSFMDFVPPIITYPKQQ